MTICWAAACAAALISAKPVARACTCTARRFRCRATTAGWTGTVASSALERNGINVGDASGARLSVGIRGSVSERVEIRALAGAFDAGDRGREFVGEVGVHVLATQRIGFTTDVQFGDGGEVLRIGMRVRF